MKIVMLLALALLSSCTPTIRQSIFPYKNSNVDVVKRGNFDFSEEEEKFLAQEAKVFNIEIPDREEIRRFVNYFLANRRVGSTFGRRKTFFRLKQKIMSPPFLLFCFLQDTQKSMV
jgi:membrane-bound lytic murein transglycosylase D